MRFGQKVVPAELHWYAFNLGMEFTMPRTLAQVWNAVMRDENPVNYKLGEYVGLHASYSAGWLEAT